MNMIITAFMQVPTKKPEIFIPGNLLEWPMREERKREKSGF